MSALMFSAHTVCFATLALPVLSVATADAADVDYDREIRPLLYHKCGACHSALKQSSGLRLDAGSLIHAGGDSGPALNPGDSNASRMMARITAADPAERMPPVGEGEKLTAVQVQLLQNWIDQGAVFPADEKIPEDPAKYWSYQPVVRPAVPETVRRDWVRNPVDAFIAAEQQRRGLSYSAEAPREVWLRRVHLDLIGLPPTREELHKFAADESPDAYENVVDELLSRTEYGERWGRHWMDVWRYSDWYGSRGINEIRYSQRHIWRWRDWIVESLNADKPYDRMIVEMLAGDEVAPSDPDVLRATGFLGRNWYKFDRNVWMFETVEQTSQAFLGLTLKCCRCHDHKFDPITHDEYYRFRAFFEPHDVRTDPISGNLLTDKDATLGPVLKEGVARVFDKQPDVRTYVFQRGDNRYPDETRPMTPGVPAALGGMLPDVVSVELPPEAFYPHLRSVVVEGLVAAAEQNEAQLRQDMDKSRADVVTAEQRITELQSRIERGEIDADQPVAPVLQDDFASQAKHWNVVSGSWSWKDGTLTESSVGSFATVVADVVHPRNFTARVQYRTLPPGSFRSVGFSFDYVDQGNSQDIYTSTGDAKQAVQAFHREKGSQQYPQAGIVPVSLKTGEITTVEITARGQNLTIALNGEHKLDYDMPVARRDGKFALWVHNGSAEFLNVELRELVPTLQDLEQQLLTTRHTVTRTERKLDTAVAETAALRARIAAEQARYGLTTASSDAPSSVVDLATAASRAERAVAVAKAAEVATDAGLKVDVLRAAVQATASAATEAGARPDSDVVKQLTLAEQEQAKAKQQLVTARAAMELPDGKYSPLGEVFGTSSTGRRRALASWIAAPGNPRTARIAVNHIWLRHFGEAIVPSVANFGLNGQLPSNPELLDWLAAELVAQNWQMKPLHRMIVLSATYRQTSAASALTDEQQQANQKIDSANRYLWRMNSRRMEAEVVRDSVLFVAKSLDTTRGGPEISDRETQTNFRRSLYFRNTPNEKAPLLETFDAANPNECYRRQESVIPQQALALMNSGLVTDHARLLAEQLAAGVAADDEAAARVSFVNAAFESVLSRLPTDAERSACLRYLEDASSVSEAGATFPAGGEVFRRKPAAEPSQRALENLIHVLFSHNDFVTIR